VIPGFRPSFRQLLLAAFVLVALVLGGLALRGQLVLESLLERSREGAERSQALAGSAERLAELALAMERAARQYLVLGDGTLRESYQRSADEAAGHVEMLAAAGVARTAAEAWRAQRRVIDGLLADGVDPARDAEVAAAFRALAAQTPPLAESLRAVTTARRAALNGDIEEARLALGRQIAGAAVLALVLALALAFALARPLARVESAIVALGENRLDTRIEIPGPSDVRKIGRRLDALRLRLAGQDADKARFLRHVSHELKTPLAALREGVALLQDGVAGPLTPDQREVSRILADNSAALQRRIEDLLSFNATAFAAQRLVRRPVELAALAREQVAAQGLLARARRLEVSVRGGPLEAEVDAALIGTALGNLLVNAIRYSPVGAAVEIVVARDGDGATITVSDEGPGIAAAERERIFEPFFRGAVQPAADDDNGAGSLGGMAGTGIGLSIVAEAVGAHGGQVHLLDTPGRRGATFRIELPHALSD
jgi:two-component system, NtrC family, sensor histidine kinase GlrK